MKMALPQLLPRAAPATLGVGLVVGGNGVMMGTRIVVSAEWVVMAQAYDELPRGVREALGDGPEVRGMRVTGRAGAGMAEPPEHHILPREFREWFEKRGFTGEMARRMEPDDHGSAAKS